MAERRMFAKTIMDSDAFLDMPLSTQALYFHLSMRADDDGFVNNAKKIQRMLGCNDDDLKILLAKNFIIPFENGVCVIKHWLIHNYIQKDRYKPTVYGDLKEKLNIKDNKVYSLDTQCIQDVSNVDTQVRLGKVRLEIDKPITVETKFPPCPYSEILSLWKKHLPHLTQPRTWEGTRQANMKQRWIQAAKKSDYSPDGYKNLKDGIDWWDSFFDYIAKDTKLANGFESNNRTWKPDLEWVMNASNFQKIIDGKYNK
jgi:hypothetical protein